MCAFSGLDAGARIPDGPASEAAAEGASPAHRACFLLLRSACRSVGGHTWRRRRAPLAVAARALARCAEPFLRRASRRFARRIFRERGDALVARIRELSGRELRVGDLLADV